MDLLDEQHGFDAMFVSEIPEYLRCIVCHLVLRNTVMVVKCGHKLCEPCLEQLKSYSKNTNTEPCCPVDRDIIDVNNVFADRGMDRIVGDLKVKCSNSGNGGQWEGELRNITAHEETCEHRVIEVECERSSVDRSSALFNELCQRMGKCEESLMEKDKDIAYLKFNLQEVKTKLNEKLTEIDQSKDRNKIENELKFEKKDFNQMEIKMENLLLKNIILEQKVESLESQLLATKKQVDDSTTNIVAVKGEIKDVSSMVDDNHRDCVKLHGDSKTCSSDDIIKRSQSTLTKISDTFKKSLNDQHDKILKLEKKVDDKILNNNENVVQNPLQKVKELENHVANIENILFCDISAGCADIVLQWKLQNYQYHCNIGNDVFSPVFFTQYKGYSFQLKVHWGGKKKGNLGVRLLLHRARYYDKALEPFNVPYSFEMLDKNGEIESTDKITLNDIKGNMNCFTLGNNFASGGYGYDNFLSMSKLRHFIINDTLSVNCRLTPQ